MEDPTLKKTATRYLKKKFIVDIFATIISDFLFMNSSTLKWSLRLKLLRFAKIDEIRKTYTQLIDKTIIDSPQLRNIYKMIIDVLLFTSLITHILICMWIRIGAVGYLAPPEERDSWLFLTGSQFNNIKDVSVYD